jgi:large subunit ribosomal protein L7/L12
VPATSVNVVLLAIGDDKYAVIKAIREITGLFFKEAKDLVEDVPTVVKQDLSRPEAEVIWLALEKAGATASLQTTPRWRANGQYPPQHTGVGNGA